MANFRDSSFPAWDLRLKIDNKTLHVHMQVLCTFSNYFRVMLNSDFIEKYQEVIELKDVVIDEFEKLLEVIYCPSYYLKRHEVEFLLVLADRFDVPIVLDKCEEYVMENLIDLELIDMWTRTYNLMNNKSICMSNVSIPLHPEKLKQKRGVMKYCLKTGPFDWNIIVQSRHNEIYLKFRSDLSTLNPQKYWELSLEVMISLRTADGHSCLNIVLFKDGIVGGEEGNHICEFTHNLCSVSKLLNFYQSTFSSECLDLSIDISVLNCNAFRKAEIFNFYKPLLDDSDTIIRLNDQDLHVHSQIIHVCLPKLAKLIRSKEDNNTKIIEVENDRELTKYLPYIIHYIYNRGSLKSMFDNFVIWQRVEKIANDLGLTIQNNNTLYTF